MGAQGWCAGLSRWGWCLVEVEDRRMEEKRSLQVRNRSNSGRNEGKSKVRCPFVHLPAKGAEERREGSSSRSGLALEGEYSGHCVALLWEAGGAGEDHLWACWWFLIGWCLSNAAHRTYKSGAEVISWQQGVRSSDARFGESGKGLKQSLEGGSVGWVIVWLQGSVKVQSELGDINLSWD